MYAVCMSTGSITFMSGAPDAQVIVEDAACLIAKRLASRNVSQSDISMYVSSIFLLSQSKLGHV